MHHDSLSGFGKVGSNQREDVQFLYYTDSYKVYYKTAWYDVHLKYHSDGCTLMDILIYEVQDKLKAIPIHTAIQVYEKVKKYLRK